MQNHIVLFGYFFRKLIFSSRAGALVRRIAYLSIGAIFVSSLSFLLVLFIMSGMNESVQKRILSLEPHLVITLKADSPLNLTAEFENSPQFYSLSKLGRDFDMVAFETQDLILRTLDGQFRGVIARGLERRGIDRFAGQVHRLENQHQEERSKDLQPVWELEANDVIVGIDLARSLGLFEGDTIQILTPEALLLPMGEVPKFTRLRVGKIVSTQLADLDAGLFVYDRDKVFWQFTESPSKRRGWEFKWQNPAVAEAAKQIFDKDNFFAIETWAERNSALFFALKLEKAMIGLFLTLAGLIAASSVLTVMSLLLSQKKKDLALMRVMGLSSRRLIHIFTSVGLLLAGVGIISGVILGTALGLWIEKYPFDILPDIYYDSQVPARVEVLYILMVLFGSGIVAFLGSWLPSTWVAKMSIANTIKK